MAVRQAPDVVIEVVSNKEGGEDTSKLALYARIRVLYYAVYDPENHLKQGTVRHFRLNQGRYERVTEGWMDGVGLGLTLWHGVYEGWDTIWLRWCDRRGDVIPTGAEHSEAESARAEAEKERADAEKERADAADQRAERLLALLREKGIDPGNG